MPYEPITNFKDSDGVDLGKKLVTKDYLLEVYGTILENSPASGLVVTPELWGWGQNAFGALGTSDTTNRSTPVTTFAGGNTWKQVSGGRYFTAAIKTDGSLWTWGRNDFAQLGINNGDTKNIPVTTFAGGNDWKQVSCGKEHTAAIKTDGSLWTWGRNDLGMLGTNDTTRRSTPVTTFAGGNTWKSVTSGGYHVVALKTDGSLWSWGHNQFGMLGDNTVTQRNIPVTTILGGTNWKSVGCGDIHTLAIKTDGSLWVWGRGADGQLGVNNTADRSIPVTTFAGGNTWKSAAGAVTHSVAVKTDGTLWTWGTNSVGELGDNTGTQRNTPVTTFAGGNNWKSVACGRSHTIALKTDGSLWTWGFGEDGRLGNFAVTNRSTPVTTFVGGNNWKQVSAGTFHTAAIQSIDYI